VLWRNLQENLEKAMMVKAKNELEQPSLFDLLAPATSDEKPAGAENKEPFKGESRNQRFQTLWGEKDVLEEPKQTLATRESGETPASRNGELWEDVLDLEELKLKVLPCQRCGLRQSARGVVFGEGSSRAKVVFVGEGPGATEDETGRPFVGRAGQLLDLMLRSVGLRREDVFIANIVKCRPPGNRLPLPSEVEACLPHLRAQIRIIRPRIIVLLGALSSQTLLDLSLRVTRDRGKWFERDGISYLVTYHPAAVLRDEVTKKRPMWEDFQSLKRKLDEISREEKDL